MGIESLRRTSNAGSNDGGAEGRVTSSLLKVLVADHDRTSRREIAAFIDSMGHACRTAADGFEALASHICNPFDVIVSDWELPRICGVELCRRTRELDGDSAFTYFVLLTGAGDRERSRRSSIDAGADALHAKPVDLEELGARLTAADRIMSHYKRLALRHRARRHDRQLSSDLAGCDSLTGLGTRRQLKEDLGAALSTATRYGRKCAAAMVDIDFKAYEHAQGHIAADLVRMVATIMRHTIRKSDRIYRYGAEEFVMVLPEQTAETAHRAVERVRQAVWGARMSAAAPRRYVTVSAGVAELSPQGDSPARWLARADSALHLARGADRSGVSAEID